MTTRKTTAKAKTAAPAVPRVGWRRTMETWHYFGAGGLTPCGAWSMTILGGGKPARGFKAKLTAREQTDRLCPACWLAAGVGEIALPVPASAPEPVSDAGLTAKQERFVEEYLIDLNGTRAARSAGYSEASAESQAYENLRKPEIARRLAVRKAEQLAAADLTATRVLEELRRVAFVDLRGLFDADGNLKPPALWTAEQGAAMASFEIIKKNAEAGDGEIDTVHKVRMLPKLHALELLSKHFKLLVERIEVDNVDELVKRLQSARAAR